MRRAMNEDTNPRTAEEARLTTDRTGSPRDHTRRAVLRGVAVGGIALPLIAACGTGAESERGGSEESPGSEPTSDSAEDSQPEAGDTTVPTSDVPVGGGTVLADEKVVVTQPSEGEYKAFSAVCTHQGCTVQTVSDGQINCPCHGSAFSVEDGSVVTGPATRPLEGLSASVEGDQVTVG
jgi:Rieske Fe-S protein